MGSDLPVKRAAPLTGASDPLLQEALGCKARERTILTMRSVKEFNVCNKSKKSAKRSFMRSSRRKKT
jgi:hypothetical protein